MKSKTETWNPLNLKLAALMAVLVTAGGVAAWVTHASREAARPESVSSAETTPSSAETPLDFVEVGSPDANAEPLAPASPGAIRAAVGRGLEYLKRTQDPRTGAWVQDVGFKFNGEYQLTASNKHHVGVTSLALMAFLSGGHLPGRGRYGEVVEKGTDFILSCVDKQSGYITHEGTRMYSHAYATLFLAEIFGMTHREDVKEKLQLAVDLTVKSQNAHGSWRYSPYATESDMSITVCQIMALRAARNIGIRVPKATIDRAYDYVVRSAYKNRSSRNYGGFRYQERSNARTSFAVTSAGVATLNHSGIYDHKLIKAGINFLKSEMVPHSRQYPWHYFFWYGHYYAAQVFFFAGDDDDGLWDWYWSRITRQLLAGQQADGSWPNSVGPGVSFATAVSCIILQVPNQYLPIFHR